MEGPFPHSHDDGASCVARAALERLRPLVSKKREEANTEPDANILPVPSKLRAILGIPNTTVPDLLACQCALCRAHGPRSNQGWDLSIEKWLEKDASLNDLAVLLLSRCLFGLRDLHDHYSYSPGGGLSSYLDKLERANVESSILDDDDPRRTLLGPLPLETDDLTVRTSMFLQEVRSKMWLVNIPFFRPQGQLIKFSEKQNLPFVGERAIPGLGPRLNKRYIRFEIAEGHAAPELENQELFAKQFTFHRSVIQSSGKEARDEVAILDLINNFRHDNIARMLFAFEEQHADPHKLSIVFKRYEHDLDSLLHKGETHLLSHFAGAVSPVEHGLWEAMLDIVDAVNTLHNPPQHQQINGRNEVNVLHAGHFDIKPANILIDTNHRPVRLLLTDFGRAHVRQYPTDQTSGYHGGAATDDYAPPEFYIKETSRPVLRLRRSYDTWSLACVLLETLAQIEQPGEFDFYHQRQMQSADNADENAAFWVFDGVQVHLKNEVHRRLENLEISQEPKMASVGRCLRKMLEVDESKRSKQTVQMCLQELRPPVTPLASYASPGQRVLMENLADRATRCRRYGEAGTSPCNLFVFRKQEPSPDDVVKLVIEIPAGPTVMVEKQSQMVAKEMFLPISFFDSLRPVGGFSRTSAVRCAFAGLHPEFDLLFAGRQDFLRFFWLMTHQQVMRGDSTDWGLTIEISECLLKPSNIFGSKKSFGPGHAQLWITCVESKYNEVFAQSNQLLSPGPTHQRRHSGETTDSGQSSSTEPPHLSSGRHNGHKLALFTSNPENPLAQRVCIIFELDRNDIQLDEKLSVREIVSFKSGPKRTSFPVMIIRPLPGTGSLHNENIYQYPGIPLSWEKLNDQIRNSETRVRELVITLPSALEGDKLRRLLAQYGPY